MDQRRRRGRQPGGAAKMERKIIERNRRNHMKDLHSKLNSLLPINYNNPTPREVVSLPDQIEEAIKYIKRLETNVKMANEKKQSSILLRNHNNKKKKKKRCGCTSTSTEIQIHEVGSSLEVVLSCGLDEHFIFREIIRILHEHSVDVVRVNSSMAPHHHHHSLMLHVLHAQIPPSLLGTTKLISEKLKSFVNDHHVETTHPHEHDLFFSSAYEVTNDDLMWDLLPNL